MREHDRAVASGIIGLMLLLWLGFLMHRSPDFAGSAWGGVFAVSGAVLMLVPLVYSVVKRVGPLRRRLASGGRMRVFLVWHIYAGIAAAILALIHTGHKFQSPLGIALTGLMLIVALSGFVGRYLLGYLSEDSRSKRDQLDVLHTEVQRLTAYLQSPPTPAAASGAVLFAGRMPESRALPLIEAVADLEYALRVEDRVRTVFGHWLKFHLAISAMLYGLLALHVWAAIEFGLRWFG
ncbi:MAG: hypothetical protein ISP90_00080 [Nevskia sp.]|nr:hypothetical protein [Nevskia sp.]